MLGASFLFSAVFRFRKVTQEIFSELHGTKTHVPISRHIHGVQRGDEGEPRGPHTMWWCGPTCRRARTWCGAHKAPQGRTFAYLSLVDGKT